MSKKDKKEKDRNREIAGVPENNPHEGEKNDLSEGEKDKPFEEAASDNGKKPYTTCVNDPDLLVKPYKPIEGKPATIKCPHCGEEMPTTIDTCVNCGHYLKKDEKRYVPMDEKKMKKIRWTLGIIMVVVFVIVMIFLGKFGSSD